MYQYVIKKEKGFDIASKQLQILILTTAVIITFILNTLPYSTISNYISVYYLFIFSIIFLMLILKDKIYAIFLLLLISFAFEEQPATVDLFLSRISNYSLWTYKIGPLNSINYIIIFLICFSIFFDYLYVNRKIKVPKQASYLLVFMIGFTIFAFINGFIRGYEFSNIFRDMQRDFYIIYGLLLSVLYIKTKNDLRILMSGFLVILIVVLSIGLFRLLNGIGMKWGTIMRVFLSATPLLLVFPFSAFTTMLCFGHYKSKAQKYFIFMLLLLTLFFCFVQLGRTVWLAIFLSISYIILFLPKKERGILLKYSLSILLIIILIINIFVPYIAKGLIIRVISIFNWNKKGYEGSYSNAVKMVEVINVFKGLIEKNDLIWGKGYGSWWTHKYEPLPKLSKFNLASSYVPGEYRHRNTHLHLLTRTLKWGLLGTLSFVALIILLLFRATQRLKPFLRNDPIYSFVFGLIPVLIFTTIENAFARPFLVYGIILGILFKATALLADENIKPQSIGISR